MRKITLLSILTLFLIALSGFTSPEKSNSTNDNITKEYNWYYKFIGNNKVPLAPSEINGFASKYDCYYLGDTSKKELYLTFDEGYENGFTSTILDILKKHKVKAAFFVVRPYIKTNPDLIKRMVAEGHIVCNHSARHPSMATIHDKDKFFKEFSDVENIYEETTGQKMLKFFRPPMGKYSKESLKLTKEYGYKTIFWSFAYRDWELNSQPTPEYARNKILQRTHNGGIILLHPVSKTNAEILDGVLTQWEKEGYTLKPLTDLPEKTNP